MDEHTFNELESIINHVTKTTDIRSRDLMYDLLDVGFIQDTDVERIREMVDEGGEGAGMIELLKVLQKNYTEACYMFVVDLLVKKQFYQIEDDVTQPVGRSEWQIDNISVRNKSMVLTEEEINTDVVISQDIETSQDDGETEEKTDESLLERLTAVLGEENMELVEEVVTRLEDKCLFIDTRIRCCCLALEKCNLTLVKLLFCTQYPFTDLRHSLRKLTLSAIKSDFVEGIEHLYSLCVCLEHEDIFLGLHLLKECVWYNSLNVIRYMLSLPNIDVSSELLIGAQSVDMLTLLLNNPYIKQTINHPTYNGETVGYKQILLSATEPDCLERVRILIEAGAVFDFINDMRFSSLYYPHYRRYRKAIAKLVNKEWFEVFFYLVDTTNTKCTSGFLQNIIHILHLKCTQCENRYDNNIYPRIHKLLNRFSIHDNDEDGNTPLLLAAECGLYDVAMFLLDQGASPHTVNYQQQNLLHIILSRTTDIRVKTLIDRLKDSLRDLDTQDRDKKTPLYYLCQRSDDEDEDDDGLIRSQITEMLLEAGCHVNNSNMHGMTPLILAVTSVKPSMLIHFKNSGITSLESPTNSTSAFNNNVETDGGTKIVELLIKHGADVNQSISSGNTALMMASMMDKTQTVQCLIEHGADVNQAGSSGFTALMMASVEGKTEIVNYLIEHGADVNQTGPSGDTAVIMALVEGNTETVKCLIEHGADVNQAEPSGYTALIMASMRGKTGGVKCLIEHGADVNQAGSSGYTALMMASVEGKTETVQCLIEHGADVNQSGPSGYTPLRMASVEGNTETVKCLIEHGADVNQAGSSGYTALMMASVGGETETVKYLIEHGADVNLADNEHETALSQFCRYDRYDNKISYIRMFKFLVESGVDLFSPYHGVNFFKLIIDRHSIEIFLYFISLKPEIVDETEHGETIFHLLAKVNYKYTIDHFDWMFHYEVDINHPNCNTETPLMIAALLLNAKYLEVFTQHPAIHINIQNNKGHTALHGCVLGFTMIIQSIKQRQDEDMVQYYGGQIYPIYIRCVDILLGARVDVNIQDNIGRTALMFAARENDKILTKKLLDAGARVDVHDVSGYCAVQYLDMFENVYDLTCFMFLLTGSGGNILDLPCINGDTFIQTALRFPRYWDTHNVASFVRLLIYYNCSLQNLKSQFGESSYNEIGLDEFSSRDRHKLRQLLYLNGAPEEEITSVLDFQVEDQADNNMDTLYSRNRELFNIFCFDLSLQSKCRRVIRQHLGLAIKENIKELDILHLVEFLLFRDVLPFDEVKILHEFDVLSDDWDYCSYDLDKTLDDNCCHYTYELSPLLTYDETIRMHFD